MYLEMLQRLGLNIVSQLFVRVRVRLMQRLIRWITVNYSLTCVISVVFSEKFLCDNLLGSVLIFYYNWPCQLFDVLPSYDTRSKASTRKGADYCAQRITARGTIEHKNSRLTVASANICVRSYIILLHIILPQDEAK